MMTAMARMWMAVLPVRADRKWIFNCRRSAAALGGQYVLAVDDANQRLAFGLSWLNGPGLRDGRIGRAQRAPLLQT